MEKEKVGIVTEEEKNEISRLYQRKLALKELLLSIPNSIVAHETNEDLYERILEDMSKTNAKFSEWWSKMNKKYQWKSIQNRVWEIDFETNEIYLNDTDCCR